MSTTPLIAHIIHRLAVGGLENGLVNLINHLPTGRYRHAIICLTDYTDFSTRIRSPQVALYALHKRPGQDWALYVKLWRLLKALRPAIVHTRNLATLEGQWPAALAGVKVRVHGEHGWDMLDIAGSSAKYRWLRRLMRPLISRYIALSGEIERYLHDCIGVPLTGISRICNGVDSQRFHPPLHGRAPLPPPGFAPPGTWVIGTVGRLETVKDPLTLVQAFLQLLNALPDGRQRLRLVLIGDGRLRSEALALLERADALELAWLSGERDDIPELLRGLDLFVLPSRAEGISNTLLEAMASALPVVATRVGGNAELVVEGQTGCLVPAANPDAIAAALRTYLETPGLMRAHGLAARRRVEHRFSLEVMVAAYLAVYDTLLNAAPMGCASLRS